MLSLLLKNRANKNLIGYYHKVTTIDELSKILNEAHTVIKSHLNYWSTADYIQDTLIIPSLSGAWFQLFEVIPLVHI